MNATKGGYGHGNLSTLVKQLDGISVEQGFATTSSWAERQREEKLKANAKLKEMYIEIINIVRAQGGRGKMGGHNGIAGIFKRKYPGFKCMDYGFPKKGGMREFIASCPGIWVDPAAKQAPIRIELENQRDPYPEELKGHLTTMQEKRRERSRSRDRQRRSRNRDREKEREERRQKRRMESGGYSYDYSKGSSRDRKHYR